MVTASRHQLGGRLQPVDHRCPNIGVDMSIEVVLVVHEAAITWDERLVSYRMRFSATTGMLKSYALKAA
jgi:hypothetical protein